MQVDNLTERIAKLSPAKRALLELKLKEKTANVASMQRIAPRVDSGPAPLSFAQERLWFLDQLDPESRAYNQPKVTRLKGPLNAAALHEALNGIMARHEVLRTVFHRSADYPFQIVGPCRPVELLTIDISELAGEEQDRRLQQIITDVVERRFDLSRDLMMRGALLKLAPTDHVLLLVTHHIASDGWSGAILWSELAALYGAFVKELPNPLPALSIQYADYAIWQRQWLQGEVLERQLSYWQKQLANLPVLELLTDRPRPPVQSYRGAKESYLFSKPLLEQLKSLSRRQGATLFMTLLAAFQTLLHRYTGQRDLAVGSPTAGRGRPELEDLIGFFVNMLVLRSNFSGNPTFEEILGAVRKTAFAAYQHQDVPFEKLVQVLHPERDLSRSPLFQVMFAFQNMPRPAREIPGLSAVPIDIRNQTSKYDLSLYMWESTGGLAASLEYSTDLFENASIRGMLEKLDTLLQAIVADPQRPVSELPLLTQVERNRLLTEWNDTDCSFPENSCLHHLFEHQVIRSPEVVALMHENEQLTYRELNNRANQLAHYLLELGIGPEVLVGISMDRSWEMLVAVLGVLKAGGAYVPLDPSYPTERLALIAEDAGISILITQSTHVAALSVGTTRVVCLDAEWKTIADRSVAPVDAALNPENLAYVIYTSGSTGKPKGVQITHRAIVNFIHSMRTRPGLSEKDVLVAVTTLCFDIAGLELHLPLSVGAQIVLASTATAADGSRLLQLIERSGATVMQATPATWRLLIESGWSSDKSIKILCGGEAVTRDLADQLLARATSVWNMYGPTETTVWSATQRISPAGAVFIGRPIDNTRIYILDSHLNPVPVGVAGELCIGGVGVARGYKNRADLTAQQFIPDPFAVQAGARLYRTGDLACYRADGSIEFIGRIDHQVKIRGFRIELGEIEANLRQHASVAQAVVVDKEITGDRRLVAYIAAVRDEISSEEELKQLLRKKLPEYMVPSLFVFLERLPLTPNGKIDRLALPLPDGQSTARNHLIVPRNLIELELARIWGKVLNLPMVSMTDNFFDVGGHSLLAVRLFTQIEDKFGKKLPLATLFEASTIEKLAQLLSREDWMPSWSSLVPIQPNGTRPPFFCVHAHGGNVLNFKELAHHLGANQPFFGIQAKGLDGMQPRHTCVEEMASDYIKEIREVQPNGPYLIGGYCFGGKVAFEMARQLRTQDEDVALLAMIDAVAPGYRTLLPWIGRRVAQIKFHYSNLRHASREQRREYLTQKGRVARRRWSNRFKATAAKICRLVGLSPPEAFSSPLRQKPRTMKIYRAKPYDGKLTVFAPAGSHSGYHRFEPHMGWNALADNLEVHQITGKVTDIIKEPYVRELAAQLRACIDQAETGKAVPIP